MKIRWLIFSTLVLETFAVYVPVPQELPEPPQVAEIFNPLVLVTPEGDSYRFIEFGQHTGITPLYAVTRMVTANQSVTRALGWSADGLSLGFFRQQAAWRYTLTAHRFDAQWKSAADGDVMLPPAEIDKLTPLVIAELNQRAESKGERLKQLLAHGLTVESVLCWQNALVLLAWLALVVTFLTLIGKAMRRFGKAR